jgi:hypothetical protein
MKRAILLVVSIAALVAALFFGASAVMANKEKPGSQTWYLDGWGGVAVNSLQMTRSTTLHDDPLTLYYGTDMVWIADAAAETDTSFTDGAWILTLQTDGNWAETSKDNPNLTVQIGGYHPADNSFYYFDTSVGTNAYVHAGKVIIVSLIEKSVETVNSGDYLCVRVTNDDSAGEHMVYFAEGGSTLVSPVSDPGYACPELQSGILLGVGLVGLVTYIATRKKKTVAAQ